jgi:transposase InsO family protein
MNDICKQFGKTRQAFYKSRKAKIDHGLQNEIVLTAVRRIRRGQPRVGGRKLHKTLPKIQIDISRDRLFTLLRENGLLVRCRRNFRKTTNSYHRFRKYRNLIKDLPITRSNQVFVADLTYIDTMEGFCYLALVTDLFSRKIVGWDLSPSLSIEGSQRALRMALKSVPDPQNLIHHSDRGIQYCSTRYVEILEKLNAQMSMTEENHVYENAVAERVNGILKTDFLLGERLFSVNHAHKHAAQAIQTYNEDRLHTSLGYRTPAECYAA